MNKYRCNNCNYIVKSSELGENYKCPMCFSSKEMFVRCEENIIDDDLEAIIDSVVDEVDENKTNKIINLDNENKIIISDINQSIERIREKCIECGKCKTTCEEEACINYNLKEVNEPICTSCGKCVQNCPASALIQKTTYREVKDIIDRNEKIVIAITNPIVKVILSELYNEEIDNIDKKIVSALRKLGFDYVLDTSFACDLSIIESVNEFGNKTKEGTLPFINSNCPATIKYLEIYYPFLLKNLSTCKNPPAIESKLIKTYFAEKKGIDSSRILIVSITTCLSEKMQIKEYIDEVDYVMTVKELEALMKEEGISLLSQAESSYDSELSEHTGSSYLYNISGGFTEGMLRTLHKVIVGKKASDSSLTLSPLRENKGIKTATIELDKTKIKVAVINGIHNLKNFIENNEYKKYHLLEIMYCENGCVSGGGQKIHPISNREEIITSRKNKLYALDKNQKHKSSHENESVKKLFKEYLDSSYSEKAQELLHSTYINKNKLLKDKKT